MIPQNNGFNKIITGLCQRLFVQPFEIWRGKTTNLSGCLTMTPEISHFHQVAVSLEMAGEKAHG